MARCGRHADDSDATHCRTAARDAGRFYLADNGVSDVVADVAIDQGGTVDGNGLEPDEAFTWWRNALR